MSKSEFCYCGTRLKKHEWQKKKRYQNYETYTHTKSTFIFISKEGTADMSAWEILTNDVREFQQNRTLVFDLNLQFQKDDNNFGDSYTIAASNIDYSLYQSKFLMQTWDDFDDINLFLSCSFLMRPEGLNCVDNDNGQFYLGYPA